MLVTVAESGAWLQCSIPNAFCHKRASGGSCSRPRAVAGPALAERGRFPGQFGGLLFGRAAKSITRATFARQRTGLEGRSLRHATATTGPARHGDSVYRRAVLCFSDGSPRGKEMREIVDAENQRATAAKEQTAGKRQGLCRSRTHLLAQIKSLRLLVAEERIRHTGEGYELVKASPAAAGGAAPPPSRAALQSSIWVAA